MKATKVGRIVFKDTDGNMIMDRAFDPTWLDTGMKIDVFVNDDARRKGVRVLSIDTNTKDVFSCTVDYLSSKRK